MKKQKSRQTGRTVLKHPPAKKLDAPRRRALHVHIALHPLNILALLCVGVLLVTFTLNAVADSYTVAAIVPAPPLTIPAVITYPADGTITGTQSIEVRGTCPANSYVELYNNGSFVGEAFCSFGTFRVAISLVAGNNQLQAQDYNTTNAPGPTSGSVIITYVSGAPQLPPDTSTVGTIVVGQLVVTQVDTNVPYQQKGTLVVSSRPIFSGVAPPLSSITVAVQSSPTCTTTANALGYWNCTVLGVSVGQHTVDVSADALGGAHLTFPAFDVTVNSNFVAVAPKLTPVHLTSSYSYTAYIVGRTVTYTLIVSGGRPPYAVMVSWGDGKNDVIIRPTASTFTISHAYDWIDAKQVTRTVNIHAIDTAGQTAFLQLDTLIRNPAFNGTVANITRSSGLWGLFNAVRPWLWLFWPGYFIVILLVVSFWLGEREELQYLKTRKLVIINPRRKRRHSPVHH